MTNKTETLKNMLGSVSDVNGLKSLLSSMIIDQLHERPEEISKDEREDLKVFIDFLIRI